MRHRNAHRPILTGLVAAVAGPASAQTTIHVALCGDDSWSGASEVCQAPDGPKATIQAAIDAATSGDTVLVLPGTYTGEGNRNLDFLGKAVSLRSRDGAEATIVDLQGHWNDDPAGFAVVRPAGGQVSLIEGLTIVNGSQENDSIIENNQQQAPLVIRACVFADNEHFGYDFPTGGVIRVYGSDVTLEECQFLRNDFYLDGPEVAYSQGGAIYVSNANLSVSDCVFEDTYATYGGGVAFVGYLEDGPDSLVVDRSVFRNLRGRGGAGVYTRETESVRVTDCLFEGNRAYDLGDSDGFANARAGGALIVANHLNLTRCEFRGNTCEVSTGPDRNARGGGAYLLPVQTAEIVDCLFAQNSADDFDRQGSEGTGGGLYLWVATDAKAHISGCTWAGNTAGLEGGGVTAYFNHTSSAAQIDNAVIHSNAGGAIAVKQTGTLVVSHSDIEGGYAGEGNIDADPLFMDAASGDYRLSAGSPCIDAGDNTAVPLSYPELPEDLGGEPRFRDDPATDDTGVGVARVVDMGAYEFQPAGPFCLADFNDDGTRNTIDFIAFLNAWNLGEPTANLFPDDRIDTRDVTAFLNVWVSGC